MEIEGFTAESAERQVIDEGKKVESVKTSVHIDDWKILEKKMEVWFTYTARYMGKDYLLHAPEIAKMTVKGRLSFSVTDPEEAEIRGFGKSNSETAIGFITIDNSHPNFALLTLPRNYNLTITRLADEKCKQLALDFLSSLGAPSPA